MFENYWFWILIYLLAIIIIKIVEYYRTKKLPPKQKELHRLYYAFVEFGCYTVLLVFFFMLRDGFANSSTANTSNLEEIQNILRQQDNHIFNIKITLLFFLMIFLMDLLPAIYNFAKAITPNDSEKILNLDNDNKEKKPILGLNI